MAKKMKQSKSTKIPFPYKGTLCAYLTGVKLKNEMSVAAFYRHRNKLLEYGWDIAKPCPVRVKAIPATDELEDIIKEWSREKSIQKS